MLDTNSAEMSDDCTVKGDYNYPYRSVIGDYTLKGFGETIGASIDSYISVQATGTTADGKFVLYVEAINSKDNVYAFDTASLAEERVNGNAEASIFDYTKKVTDKVTLKAPNGKKKTFYKIEQENANFTVVFTPDTIDLTPSAVSSIISTSDNSNNIAYIIVIGAETIAIIALAITVVSLKKKKAE